MNLDLLNRVVNATKTNSFVQSFIKELTNYLNNSGRICSNMCDKKNMDNITNVGELREENCLYQVVDRGLNGIYLQNLNSNKVFEEMAISKDLQDKLVNDCILRYKNGKYIFEEKLTEDFFNGLVDIEEYKNGK